VTPDDELLEVHDAAGHATGVAKTRGTVHRDGDWHLARSDAYASRRYSGRASMARR
jgi:hypothetical protein